MAYILYCNNINDNCVYIQTYCICTYTTCRDYIDDTIMNTIMSSQPGKHIRKGDKM